MFCFVFVFTVREGYLCEKYMIIHLLSSHVVYVFNLPLCKDPR